MWRAFSALGLTDLRSIRRDSMLLSIAVSPWLLVLFLRLMIPSLDSWLLGSYGMTLEAYYPLIVSIFILLNVPLLFGVMSGFLLLDERDDDTLTVLRVTPASIEGLVFYRVVTSFVLSVLYIIVCAPLTGLVSLDGMMEAIPATLLAATFTPVVMLTLVAFASNKLEGFAVLKGVGIVVVGSASAYFVDSSWQILFGLIPTYWQTKAFWLALAGESYGMHLVIGFAYQLLLIWALFRRFRNRLN